MVRSSRLHHLHSVHRLAVCLGLTIALGLPTVAGAEVRSDEERVVRAVYDRLTELAAAARYPVRFELTDFQTVAWSRFDAIPYTDVATLPTGDLLRLEQATGDLRNRPGSRAVRHVTYELFWQPAGSDYLASAEGREVAALTLAGFLRRVEDPRVAGADALTRFRVTVHSAGRQRTYGAAFLWFREAGEIVEFQVLDHVTGGVDLAAGEELPTRAEARRLLETTPQRAGAGLERVTAASHACYPSSTKREQPREATGWGGHRTGHHRGKVTFDVYCSCDQACTSTCEAQVRNGTGLCSDWGDTSDSCHKMVVKHKGSGYFEGDGHLNGASCHVGFACAQRSCFGCLCDLVLGLDANRFGVSFSYSTPPNWRAELEFGGTCERCTEQLHSGPACDDGPTDPWEPPQLTTSDGGLSRITAALCQDPDSTPIVVDMAGDGFRFTSVDEGVHFDFDGVGPAERMAWTEAGSDDAFLVADVNRNGRIDHGRELFGNLTAQPQDRGGLHGYNALQQYDDGVGGDRDGVITRRDSYFAELMLWRDANHNGISEPEELTWLADTAIEGIDLGYVESRRRDRHGNELRYTSKVPLLRGAVEHGAKPGRRHVMATDVILQVGH